MSGVQQNIALVSVQAVGNRAPMFLADATSSHLSTIRSQILPSAAKNEKEKRGVVSKSR